MINPIALLAASRGLGVAPVLSIITFVALLMAIGLAWSATHVIEPLGALEAGAQALARGDFQHRVAASLARSLLSPKSR